MRSTVFISGTGRCGSNILKNILSLHDKVASLPFEQRYTVDPDGIFDFYKSIDSWSPFIADKKIERLSSFLRGLSTKTIRSTQEVKRKKLPYQDWELNLWIPGYSLFVSELMASISTFTYEARYPGKPQENEMSYYSNDRTTIKKALIEFQEKCNNSMRLKHKGEILVEDNTWTFLFAKEALELTPNALLIHIIRDPRDVISSMKEQRWTPKGLKELVQYYKDLIGTWNKQKMLINSDQFLEIRFEDLISNSEKSLNDICKKIGLSFTRTMLELDLSKANTGRYKSTFTVSEIEFLNTSLGDILLHYKYI